eukprot:TRINITY_DN12822_c0_g1_i2.p1 TRINITY_DN12822_c0_g1~~TRINITY_DN12822_c0_g1_i2.p1  ORF type:complete len:838 (+),score=143.27 TRINITY_DN12822_c0_g1_i2:119-2632(+)
MYHVVTVLLLLFVIDAASQKGDCYVDRELRLERITDWTTQYNNVWFREEGTDRNVTAQQFTVQISLCENSVLGGGGGGLSVCGRNGRIAIFDNTGACLEVFDQIQSPIEEVSQGSGSTVTTYSSSATGIRFSILVSCDPDGQDSTIAVEEAVPGDRYLMATPAFINSNDILTFQDWTMNFTSRAGCRINERLCTIGQVYCPTYLSCYGNPGVCADANCIKVQKESTPDNSITGANYKGDISVVDCRGTTVPGLTTEDFVVRVDNGERMFRGMTEGAILVTQSEASSNLVKLSSLLLDQSESVLQTDKASLLTAGVSTFLTSVFNNTQNPPRVGMFSFDGSADVGVIPPSYSSDQAALQTALQDMQAQQPGDIRSTNLYGAVRDVIYHTEVVTRSINETEQRSYQSAIVIFSDGKDTSKRVGSQESIDAASRYKSLENNKIFFIDLLTGTVPSDYVTKVASPGLSWKIDQSELSTTFTEIGTLLSISAARYFVGLCTAIRKGKHALFVDLDRTRLGIPTTNPNPPVYWVFDSESFIEQDCTQSTLESAAAATDVATAEQPELQVLSKFNSRLNNITGYFVIETVGMQAPSSVSVQPPEFQILLSDIEGSCKTVSKLCFDSNSTSSLTLLDSQMGTTKQLSALIIGPDGEALRAGQFASVSLLFTNRVDPPSPTIAPTPVPGDEGEKLRNVLLIVFGGILLICILCLIAFCCFNKERKSERHPSRKELYEQLRAQQEEEDQRPYELSALVPPQTTVGSYPLPPGAHHYPSVQNSMAAANSVYFFEDGDSPVPLPSGYQNFASIKNASGTAAVQNTLDEASPNFRSDYDVIDNGFIRHTH